MFAIFYLTKTARVCVFLMFDAHLCVRALLLAF